jgi:4-amino-4-deoxy-L-arabinose transferase-like glycosyltransferase
MRLGVGASSGSETAVPPRWRLPCAAPRMSVTTAWWIVAAATIVAAGLRLPFLGHQSLWFDEVYTREILGESTLPGLWRHVRRTESTPPLYYILGWLVGARSAVAMRLIPALALTAAVPVSYMAMRRLVGQRAALAGAAILAVNPLLVSYATDARSYGLFVLTALLSVWAFAALLEDASWHRYALWAAAAITCVWTHYFGFFVCGAEAIVLLVALPRERVRTTASLAAVALCLLPLVSLVATQAGDARAAFIEGSPLGSRLVTTTRQLAMGANVPRTWLEAAGLALWSVTVATGALRALRSGSRGARALLALATITVGAPLLLALSGVEDRFYARNLILAAPLAAALAAPSMLRLRAAPLAAYLALALLTSVWVATNWRYQQVDWRDALARVEAVNAGAPVLAVTSFGAPVVHTYLHRRAVPPRGLVTRRAWVVVEPTRASGQRALGLTRAPKLAGFETVREWRVDGFRLILVGAGHPTAIVPGTATLFSGRA